MIFWKPKSTIFTICHHKIRERSKGHGFGYIVVNEPDNPTPVANTILATGGSGKERNLVRQHKAGVAGRTVKTKKTPLNDEGIRVMTPTEWGRLQGFIGYGFVNSETGEDEFSFPENTALAQQYKQFGNSVTIPVIEEMARFMLECFDKMTRDQLKLIIQFAKNNEYITRRDVIELLRITSNQAGYLLRKLVADQKLNMIDTRKKARYTLV